MTDILRYLIEYCAFVYESGRFRFVDSQVTGAFGGEAYLVLESATLRLRFVRERGQLFLDFQGTRQKHKRHWYSVDLFPRLINGERRASAELDPEYARFLERHLSGIEEMFEESRLEVTLDKLHQLELMRSKEMFG